jgi:hypothetical protein
MKLSPRTVLINMRVSEDFKEAAEGAAVRDNRSLTGYIEKLVIDDLRRDGQLDEDAGPKKAPAKRK